MYYINNVSNNTCIQYVGTNMHVHVLNYAQPPQTMGKYKRSHIHPTNNTSCSQIYDI